MTQIKHRNHPQYLDKYTVTTTNGERFYGGESALLAFLIHRRFGGDYKVSHAKWCKMLNNNCDLQQFKQLVNYGGTEAGSFHLHYREGATT